MSLSICWWNRASEATLRRLCEHAVEKSLILVSKKKQSSLGSLVFCLLAFPGFSLLLLQVVVVVCTIFLQSRISKLTIRSSNIHFIMCEWRIFLPTLLSSDSKWISKKTTLEQYQQSLTKLKQALNSSLEGQGNDAVEERTDRYYVGTDEIGLKHR
jgi:hypothetical protein